MTRELIEFQDAKLAQKVASRYIAATSATPIFDELYRINSKVTPSLSKLADQIGAVSDKVANAAKLGRYVDVLSLSRSALDLAYKVFAPFRPMLTRAADSELAALKSLSETQVVKSALWLHEVVSSNLSQKYNAVAQAAQDLDQILSSDNRRGLDSIIERAKDAVEALALEAAHVKNFYTQYVRAYAG